MLNIAQVIGLIKRFGGGGSSGSGGSSVQPDWNQNDETQPDYVKNRTHYKYGTTSVSHDSTDGLESVTLTYDDGTEMIYYKISSDYPDPTDVAFTEDPSAPKYHMTSDYSFNAATADDPCWYICYAGGVPRVIALPDTAAMLDDAFLNSYYPDQTVPSAGVWVLAPGTFDENWLSYTVGTEHTVCLPECYIPETIARKSDISWENMQNKPFGVPIEPIITFDVVDGYFRFNSKADESTFKSQLCTSVGNVYSVTSSAGWHAKFKFIYMSFGNEYYAEIISGEYPDCPIEVISYYAGTDSRVLKDGQVVSITETLSIYEEDKYGETTLDEKYIPDTIQRVSDMPVAEAVADAAGDAPTAAEFNALLASLRTAGLLKT